METAGNLSHNMAMVADDLAHPLLLNSQLNKPFDYYTANPYQSVIRPMPRSIQTESRLMNSSNHTRTKIQIRNLRVLFALQLLSGILSILCAGLLIPYGASHSDTIHSVSFLFGLLYCTSAVSLWVCTRWQSASSEKICLIVNVFAIVISFVAFFIGLMSIFHLFDGNGSPHKAQLSEDHHEIATNALTLLSMLAAVVEMFTAAYIAQTIIRARRKQTSQKSRPVRL